MKTNRGFTLIELLVVIAIIGILSGVVLTGLSSARTKAKDSRVVSSLKQAKNLAELNRQANGNPLPVNTSGVVVGFRLLPDFLSLFNDVCIQQGRSSTCAWDTRIQTSPAARYYGVRYEVSGSNYCVYAWLPSGIVSGLATKAKCMDSTGQVKDFTPSPSVTSTTACSQAKCI